MGYMIAFGPCVGCGLVFGFNPHRVPSSSAVTGERAPICRTCIERINPLRKRHGLPPIVPAPDAYEPAEE
jgi:hypothetical protein